MPISLREKVESRQSQEGENRSATLVYDLAGTSDDIAAKVFATANTPTLYDGMVRQSLSIEPQVVDAVVSDGLWLVTVRYGNVTDHPQTGESSFCFDTGGGTQHLTQSLQTIQKCAPTGQTAPDFAGAIGVTHDNVEGVDVTIPVYQFSETHYLADGAVDQTYKLALFGLTGKVNDAAFRGFSAGEVLFLGAAGSKRGDFGDWEITFKFAASKNATNLTVGGITGIDKKGWEYMWVRYADAEDEVSMTLVKKPVAVYVEKVYESASFAGLGIGT